MSRLYLLAHDLQLTVNVGVLFRMADALGVDKLLLSGSTPRLPNRKVSKVARSTEKYVDYADVENVEQCLAALKRDGFQLLALELNDDSVDVREHAVEGDICLLLGAEIDGVSPELLALADDAVYIPMQGKNHSMNVVMAAALAVWELRR